MQLKHLKTLVSPQDGAAKVTAMAWAPNNSKLAVSTVDRVVTLFDDQGEKRDKFATKPADPALGKKCYQVSALAFSPDSSKIAVGQTDNIIFVYRLGEKWGEKKTICNKIICTGAITCLVWPPNHPSFVVGLSDGKVRLAGAKGSKSQTIYATESYVVSLALSPSGKGILSGHADGTVVRYLFEDDGSGLAQGPVCRHTCAPYALAWASASIMAGGCDRRIVAYGQNGKVLQQFDYSNQDDEKEFMCACASPSGQSVVMGSFDRIRVYDWAPRKEAWEEAPSKVIPNLYTVTCLSWKKDGSRLVAGSLCGAVELFDCCLRKVLYRNKFEMTYVGLSQVIVKNLNTGARVVLKSHYGYEIEKVQIMGKERYLVAHTSDTLLLGDLASCKLSEVAWQDTGGNEKFYFENDNVCMIFNAGELILVEYGINDLLGSVRTEFMNPHLISIRINERRQKSDLTDNKKLAYLQDLHTACIVDLQMGVTIATFTHDLKINWLELNETGRKLLFRDKKLRLHLFDIESQSRSSLLNYCSYVQWVPLSDVVVAQNRGNLCVWYNIDMPDRVTMFPLKGEVVDLERLNGRTEVLVQSGVDTISYTLDEGLIEFGTAMDDGDLLRGLSFLETLEMTSETEAMWKTLGELALQTMQLKIAERCYAALGDVARARYMRETNLLSHKIFNETGLDGRGHYLVQAKLAVLNKQFKLAESMYLERGDVDSAIAMHKELNRWDDAIAVAESRNHSEVEALRTEYFEWLLSSHQEERAGEWKERQGDFMAAITLYMKAGLPSKAARLVMQEKELVSQSDLLQHIASALLKSGQNEKAGELYEMVHCHQQAMEAYKSGGVFRRAVELARASFPSDVVHLEELWGRHLSKQKQFDAAIMHFIEAGCLQEAIGAAIHARQWNKAVQILETQEPEDCAKFYHQIAQHYASTRDYKLAEQYFIKAGSPREAMDMYIGVGRWEEAYELACSCMSPEDTRQLYVTRARALEEEEGHLREAERLYVIVEEPDLAITMYKKHKQYDQMIRLVSTHHEDLLVDTHLHLAKELEAEGQIREAEKHFASGGDWKAAVNMYRLRNHWEDAYRVAKENGGSNASNQVAYLWAKSLGGESAVKLLTKFGLLEAAVDYATENFSFDFALDVAKVALKSKLPEIHTKKALYLEDEGKISEAEEEFVRAGRPKEAVLMYVHQQDWASAQRVAELHCPESITDVLVGQARVAFDQKDYQKAESYLLRADRPDVVASFYKENEMWVDALRIIKDYLPHKLDDFQREMEAKTGKDYENLLSQARAWEQSGEHSRAIDFYLQVTTQNCKDNAILQSCWERAVDLALKFVPARCTDVVTLVSDRLANIGKYMQAGELLMENNLVKESLDMFMAGEAWDKAREIARNIAPRYESYVEEAYVQYLKQQNRPDKMQSVDLDGALKMYAQSGQWEKCIELAEKQGGDIKAKYVALYAAHLIKSNAALSALKLFDRMGAPANPQNFNIYKHLSLEIFGSSFEGSQGYQIYAMLRNMLFDLVNQLSRSPESGNLPHRQFEEHLLVAHYLATRAACGSLKQLEKILTKLSVSLLRYTATVPADKAFYEAGLHCRAVGWDNMAFIFFNRFLDLSEAIEEGSLDMLDNTDFADTDIPFEVPLSESPYLPEDKREEVKEWVLAVSMDQKVEQVLPVDERGTYEAALSCPHTHVVSLPCVVTGYPVLRQSVEFRKGSHCANQVDWNKFVTTAKMSSSEECLDVLRFLNQWCGAPLNPSYSFK